MSENRASQNELVLSMDEYAYTQDLTSGVIKVHTGPNVVNVTGQEYPVNYNQTTGRFEKVSLADATRQFVTAKQGEYIVLSNPAVNGKQPDTKSKAAAAELNIGQKVILQGPCTFALWPGQSETVIEGHNLRSNQYLSIRVYDEGGARENWTKGVIKAAQANDEDSKTTEKRSKERNENKRATLFDVVPEDLAVGKHYIVRGDEFSFYIPPTGVEVVQDEDSGNYVRNAITLERLEYCILIDEDGNKRYPRGPAVVFPRPTERFHEEFDRKGNAHHVFAPIELNEIQGLHVKVIADYEENGVQYAEGQELFITGKQTQIYFPRQEHSLVSYDGKHKHFAISIPPGQARYVLNRNTGEIKTVKGPTMFLPDPRTEVIVNRALGDKECTLFYPGNLEALKYNARLRELAAYTPTTRSGTVSDGEIERSKKIKSSPRGLSNVAAEKSLTSSDSLAYGAEEFSRMSTYTEPRSITFGNKFSGVPSINVWTGFAVMVVDKRGNRRVEIGPKTVLLEFDESLEVLEMSTGRPKVHEELLQTVYLRVKNNGVGDVIFAETADHVDVGIKVELKVNFEGDPTKWFDAENYVKMLCDHVRSMVKSTVRQYKVRDLYADPTSIVRDSILGAKAEGPRPGLVFNENGMVVTDVEVLSFKVGDDKIANMLDNNQHRVIESNIELALAEKQLEIDRRNEEIARERAQLKNETVKLQHQLAADTEEFKNNLENDRVKRNLELNLAKLKAQLAENDEKTKVIDAEEKLTDERQERELKRRESAAKLENAIQTALQELTLAKTKAETQAVIDRFNAASGTFAEALTTLGNQETLVKVAEAMGIGTFIGGKTLPETISKVFEGSPIEGLLNSTFAKALPNGKNGATPSTSKGPRIS